MELEFISIRLYESSNVTLIDTIHKLQYWQDKDIISLKANMEEMKCLLQLKMMQ